jgi:hypothetical protein
MFNRVQSKKSLEGATPSVHFSVTPAKPQPVGRERLLHIDAELARANSATAEIEEKVARLEAILVEADQHHEALQLAIMLDGGRALADLAGGKVSDDSDIGKLATLADSSARARAAAVAALPKARADLQDVQQQAVQLDHARIAEVDRVIAGMADVEARQYESAFSRVCRLHDRLVGYCSVMENNQGEIRLSQEGLRLPRFALPSLGHADSDPYIRHTTPSSLTVGESARHWRAVRERLLADSLAAIDP